MANKREADQEKIQKILEKRCYKDGKPPRRYEVHHVKPLAEGGKDAPKNLRAIKKTKHQQMHANRKKQGKI